MTTSERNTFCKWLEAQISSNLQIIPMISAVNNKLANVYRDKTKAYQLVLSDLLLFETMEIK